MSNSIFLPILIHLWKSLFSKDWREYEIHVAADVGTSFSLDFQSPLLVCAGVTILPAEAEVHL